MRILADTCPSIPDVVEGFADTLLMPMAARASSILPFQSLHGIVSPGLPPVCVEMHAAIQANRVPVWFGEYARANRPGAITAHGWGVDVIRELFKPCVAIAILIVIGLSVGARNGGVPDKGARAGGMRHGVEFGLLMDKLVL